MIRNLKLEISNSLTFYVKVFGCQYNEWDATRLAFALKKLGLIEADAEDAEIVFILNCSVRKSGVDRALGFVKNLTSPSLSLKRRGTIVVTGCVLVADRPRFEKKGVILWDGEDFSKLSEILQIEIPLELTAYNLPLTTSFVPIMKGCDNFCSYCAVPYVRGREISRPFADVISDVKNLVSAGHREITLLGQNVNSYHAPAVIHAKAGIQNNVLDPRVNLPAGQAGPEDDNKSGFATLLKAINDIEGNFVIKFTSNHPKDMSDEIIEAIATLPKIAKEVHLPLQSGSNKVLKSMNRPYTKEQYLELVEKIKTKIPDVKITTDVIVGYPNETEEDFEQTVEIFNKVKYFQAYINKYSPREGTVAFKLGDPVPWPEKDRRWRILNEIANKK